MSLPAIALLVTGALIALVASGDRVLRALLAGSVGATVLWGIMAVLALHAVFWGFSKLSRP